MIYYELKNRFYTGTVAHEGTAKPAGIYCKDIYLRDGDMPYGIVAYSASRIWREQDGTVVYVKYARGVTADQVVDMQEFLFIKLRAVRL